MAEQVDIAAALAAIGGVASEDADPAKCGCARLHGAAPEAVPAVARVFRGAGYMLEMLTALDMRASDQAMHVVYMFNRLGAPDRHRLRVVAPTGTSVPSIADVFESANWYEREAFDMLGVSFDGHPQLTRILTEEGADYHPLLKDFGNAPEPAKEGGDD